MRIGIVNHTRQATQALRRDIHRNGKHHVVWLAHAGAEAVAHCQRDCPDLVIMDLFLPDMDGSEATRQIMSHTPCAIIIATVNLEQHMGKVFEAMGAGALDAVSLPGINLDPELTATQTLPGRPGMGELKVKNTKLKNAAADIAVVEFCPDNSAPLLAKIETIRRLLGTPEESEQRAVRRPPPTAHRLVAIGASAGGPTALATILAALPAHFPAAVIIVQHLDQQFAPGLTAWFATRTKLPVRVAQPGDRVAPGTIYLAGRDQHLILANPTQLDYTPQPGDTPHRPSIDVFFHSIARQWPGQVTGVLLTGMGRDGAAGLRTLRQAGHHTIAQDKNTSAVYGMPQAAAALDAAKEILPLHKIGPRLTKIHPTRAPYKSSPKET